MRPVNLIPPEDRRGERAPLRTGPLAYVVVGVLLLGFVGLYMLVSTGNSISEREAEVALLEQSLDSTTARADALQSFSSFASLEQARTQTVTDLARSRFDWERVMRELALVIPADVSLDQLAGSIANAEGAAASAAAIEAPTLTLAGCGTKHGSVARLVAALRDIDGVTRVGLANSTKGDVEGGAASTTTPTDDGTATSAICLGERVACGNKSNEICRDPAVRFEITVAFDEVAIDPLGGGLLPPAEPVPASGDESGVAEAEQERKAAKDSVDSATQDADQAVDQFVPGA